MKMANMGVANGGLELDMASSSPSTGNVNEEALREVDISKLGPQELHIFIERLIKNIEKDNLHLLQKIRQRLDRVGVKLPTVEVRYRNLCVEDECDVIHAKPLPTLWNSLKCMLRYPAVKMFGSKSHQAKISIVNNVSGIINPGRMTLLRGPPGGGKTSLLNALSGNLSKALKVAIEIPYLFAQGAVYVIITCTMIGYNWTAHNVFLYFNDMLFTLLYFNLLGMLLVSLTPDVAKAQALTAFFYPMMNIFCGFLTPKRNIPKWWIWLYYVMPTSWTLNCMLTSQYGNVNDEIVVHTETTTTASLLEDYFGFRYGYLPITALVVLFYPLILSISSYIFHNSFKL